MAQTPTAATEWSVRGTFGLLFAVPFLVSAFVRADPRTRAWERQTANLSSPVALGVAVRGAPFQLGDRAVRQYGRPSKPAGACDAA